MLVQCNTPIISHPLPLLLSVYSFCDEMLCCHRVHQMTVHGGGDDFTGCWRSESRHADGRTGLEQRHGLLHVDCEPWPWFSAPCRPVARSRPSRTRSGWTTGRAGPRDPPALPGPCDRFIHRVMAICRRRMSMTMSESPSLCSTRPPSRSCPLFRRPAHQAADGCSPCRIVGQPAR